jgi:prepilin-type processing-associated H-X9-DG protein
MSGQQSEQLLGYLLGALEDDERRQFETHLRHDVVLRAELGRLRSCLEPLENSWQPVGTPPGLWQRTCRFVEVAARVVPRGAAAMCRASMSAGAGGGLSRRSAWSWREAVAAAAVLVAACLVLFPAVNRSRFQAAVRGCQNNLAQLGASFQRFAEAHDGRFPQVPREGNDAFAGVYAAVLQDYGMLDDSRYLICPAVAAQRQNVIYVPSCAELRSATPPQLAELRRNMCGDYGYHLGFVVDGQYLAVRDQDRPTFAILADAPSPQLDGQPSTNHARVGQNILFVDGSVRFIRCEDLVNGCVLVRDNLFLNDDNEVAPGKHPGDAVIAPPQARPVKWGR